MDAVKYLKETMRMCDTTKDCEECPFHNLNATFPCHSCPGHLDVANPEKAVEIVEKWAAEHPKKTRQSEFLKMFPRVPMKNGLLLTNPCWVDSTVKCLKQKSDGVYEDAPEKCVECRKKYWLTEVE